MAWLCLRNNDYRNSQMCIVTGPNQDIAIKLIKRMKGLFDNKLASSSSSVSPVIVWVQTGSPASLQFNDKVIL